MKHSAALTGSLHDEAARHLLQKEGQEDLCFAIWHPSQGRARMTALVHSLVLPEEGDRVLSGNASFMPSYFRRSLASAIKAGGGLAFMHSHLGPGWQDMSEDDFVAESEHAPASWGGTGLPLLGMTIGTDGSWSARLWVRIGPHQYQRSWCQSVRVVGEGFSITYHDGILAPPIHSAKLERTESSWGLETQDKLARLKIGVIGAGSVGGIVAEGLARVGISRIMIMDFDSVEMVNLDRLLHATEEDASLERAKVRVLERALRDSATARPVKIEPLEWSVCEPDGFSEALDCDILFSCVDRPWPRSVLNLIAYAHLIPVIDGGISIRIKSSRRGILYGDWRAHIAGPLHRCLECLKQYDPGLVSAERDGHLDDPHYIEGLPNDSPLRRNENVFAFSLNLASLELLQFIHMTTNPAGVSNPGAFAYHLGPATLDKDYRDCESNCLYPSQVALGDHCGVTVTGQHRIAEQKRGQRILAARSSP